MLREAPVQQRAHTALHVLLADELQAVDQIRKVGVVREVEHVTQQELLVLCTYAQMQRLAM